MRYQLREYFGEYYIWDEKIQHMRYFGTDSKKAQQEIEQLNSLDQLDLLKEQFQNLIKMVECVEGVRGVISLSPHMQQMLKYWNGEH